ncbi:hypothetical protein M409DRAFT_30210 [Zasmidium cellare ATCC 36951]|uniref:Nucleoporin Nup133/Nup155-like N-terminal domain-containing protein n=1 Tax=Zasmidium cellare ATCC 36951 TaxID=1080233 RepID=A0A6A6BWX3_ZASCE|nr:uncharacterized protein M409DRAFT_30210 [Zasmidium cellare ATCC 36951]KAF2159334.1 hypothetical protein M409DRAFT_30210 [Zasmidium cellare ATCC 36951]
MAAAAGPMTPQRPLPGAFTVTPANPAQGSTIFAAQAASLKQNLAPQTSGSPGTASSSKDTTGVEDAAKTINTVLQFDANFPAMEDYIQQGISGKYELPSAQAWQPFQKLKMHDLPPKLLEQANLTGMGMVMGIFPPLSHAWVALDNCLYLWDYTMPNPEIIGFEENTQPITAVKLVPPKPGVFIEDIKHMIVICTANDMLLLGVAAQTTSTGAQTVALYNTRMSIPIRGLGVTLIEASKKTGRIFFTGRLSDDIYEFQYQQDEGWFRGKCNRLCHTKSTMNFVSENIQAVGQYFGPQQRAKALRQLLIDDSRNMLYSLSSSNEIKVWLIKERLESSLVRPMHALLQNTGHFSSRTELLTGRDVALAAISAIPLAEASKVSLMATTNTGCRLYISLTRGYGFPADSQNPPSSMQILHIRFPPKDPNAPAPAPQQTTSSLTSYGQASNEPAVDNTSTYLKPTNMAYRFSPGYFMAFQPDPADPHKDRMFCAAPDTARLANRSESAPGTNFTEYGQWIDLPAEMQQVMAMSGDFGAAGQPTGFGNELAVQFDASSPEFAIVTTSGVQTIRRRRLVDIFAALMKYGSSHADGVEGDIKHFVRTYGRAETAATSLAVACGQGTDVAENRVATVTDPEVLEKARRAFIEHGGKPEWSINNEEVPNGGAVDNTKPSPRYDGTALYVSRIVRSIWKQTIIKDLAKPGAGAKLAPTIRLDKLRSIQRDLSALKEFLDRNRSFIEGLAGPQALSKATTRQEELAIQGEHQKMHALLQLINSISEGISFVLVLFDETIEDVLALLHEDSRNRTKQLTFEGLFVSTSGRELAKELVKAIVNRNIANGSNVDTVAEALRRRCGSFCSADDVVIFKASEQIRRAEDSQGRTEGARMLLNESSKLFQRVAGSLTYENVKSAVESYYRMAFYAGAIQLCLTVAHEKDTSKRALSWTRDGRPANDAREAAFNERKQYYDLIFATLKQLDNDTESVPQVEDGKYTLALRRRNEAYDIVNHSDDIAFLATLYDWYCNDLQEPERLLEIDNPYVIEYLKQMSVPSRPHADLLWRYYAHHNDYLQAASIQVQIAQSHFEGLKLEERIGYLSRARTNASTRQTVLTDNRQSKQKLLREVSDLIDIAAVQDELLQRFRNESRLPAEKRNELVEKLSYVVLPVNQLYNEFADAAGYHDICILIYQVANHSNPADIATSWKHLIDQTHEESYALYGRARRPWEAVGEKVLTLGRRLHTSAAFFPIHILLPLLEKYTMQPQEEHPPSSWAIDIMLDLEIPHETLLPVLEQLYYSNEHPFVGGRRKIVAGKMVYLLLKWFEASVRSGERVLFGSEENASTVQDCLASLLRGDLDVQWRQNAENLAARITQATR